MMLLFGPPKFLLSMYREVDDRSCVDTGGKARAWCLRIHAEASLSRGVQGERLVPPHTRGSVSLVCGLFASEIFLDPTPDDFDNAYFMGITKPVVGLCGLTRGGPRLVSALEAPM